MFNGKSNLSRLNRNKKTKKIISSKTAKRTFEIAKNDNERVETAKYDSSALSACNRNSEFWKNVFTMPDSELQRDTKLSDEMRFAFSAYSKVGNSSFSPSLPSPILQARSKTETANESLFPPSHANHMRMRMRLRASKRNYELHSTVDNGRQSCELKKQSRKCDRENENMSSGEISKILHCVNRIFDFSPQDMFLLSPSQIANHKYFPKLFSHTRFDLRASLLGILINHFSSVVR